MPPDWRDWLGALAAAFGWEPAALYAIPLSELRPWVRQAVKWKGGRDGKG